MDQKDIERKLTAYCGGSAFCRASQLAGFLGQKNVDRVKKRYLRDLSVLEGTRSYWIPDVAREIYYSQDYSKTGD